MKTWPKLAWVARGGLGSPNVHVYHGPCVELQEEWLVEGVWASDYAKGDFDATDLFAGTGLRLRPGRLVAVTAGNVMDVLWRLQVGREWYLSNSLPVLLAASGARFVDGFDYSAALMTISKGVDDYERQIPSSLGSIERYYYQNIVWDGRAWYSLPKPNSAPAFPTFADYYGFLEATARAFVANSQASGRRYAIHPLIALSSGYDSTAVAVLARAAGCREAVTIKNARSRLPHSDSGQHIAEILGLNCKGYTRDPKNVRYEEELWAAMGIGCDSTFTMFDYPQPVTLLFTGYYGDTLWDREPNLGAVRALARRASGGSRFVEFRLAAGVIFCSMVYWGIQRAVEIVKITQSPEMAPWTLGTDYDRPIPRRIVETAGVPRGSFARKKLMSSFSPEIARPFSASLRSDFERFAEGRGHRAPSRWQETQVKAVNIVYAALSRLKVFGSKFAQRPLPHPPHDVFFRWANERLTQRYEAALREGEVEAVVAESAEGARRTFVAGGRGV